MKHKSILFAGLLVIGLAGRRLRPRRDTRCGSRDGSAGCNPSASGDRSAGCRAGRDGNAQDVPHCRHHAKRYERRSIQSVHVDGPAIGAKRNGRPVGS